MNTNKIEKLIALKFPFRNKRKNNNNNNTRMDIYRPFSRPRTPMIESRLNFLI